MGIEAKNIPVCIWRIVKIFMNICIAIVQRHPCVSGTVLFLFFLYRFYPFVFQFFIYSFPVLVCTIVFLGFLLSSKRPRTQNFSEDEKKNQGISFENSGFIDDNFVVKRNEKSPISTQTVCQRNVKENSKVLDDLVVRSISKEEKQKEIQEGKGSSSLDYGKNVALNASDAEHVRLLDEQLRARALDSEPSSSNIISRNGSDEWSYKYGSAGDIEALNLEEAEDEDEEEAQEDGIKAVEWTADDQKNLMDLGTSEIERNKRLESLIAKRKARKLLSMQVQRNLIDFDSELPLGQVAPILTARHNPFDLPFNPNEPEVLPMPGSAPSVLLPMRNPFDLPYDPHEEKPNLTGDSFHQEFLAAQKDFCRHESISLGTFFTVECKQDRSESKLNPFFDTERRTSEGPKISRFKRQSDDKLVEQVSSSGGENASYYESGHDVKQEGKTSGRVENWVRFDHDSDGKNVKGEGKGDDCHMESRVADGREVHTRPGLVEDNNSNPNASMSMLGANEDKFNAKEYKLPELEPRMSNFPTVFNNSLQKSFTFSVSNNITMDFDNTGPTSEPCYDSSPSANDKARMEQHLFFDREVGHTPTHSIASDMLVEVSEGGSPRTVTPPDGESITSVSEETWGAPSHQSGVEENESRSRSVHEIREQDIIAVGFSRVKQKSEDLIAIPRFQEGVIEPANTSTSSYSYSYSSGSSEDFSGDYFSFLVPEKAQNSTKELAAHTSGNSVKPKGPSKPPEKPSNEVNINHNEIKPVGHASKDTEHRQPVKDNNGDSQPLIMHKANKALSEAAVGASSKLNESVEKKIKEPEEHKTILESHTPVNENGKSETKKQVEGEFGQLTQNKSSENDLKVIEDKENMTSVQDTAGEQGRIEVGISGLDLNFDNSTIALVTEPEMVLEPVRFDSSSSSSPKSVLPENVFKDQDLSSNSDYLIQAAAQLINMDDNSSHQMSPENLDLPVPQNAKHFAGDSIDFPSSIRRDAENLQESSSRPGKSFEEAKITNSAKELPVHEKAGNGISRSVQNIGDESQNSIRHRATAELIKPSEEATVKSSGDIKGVVKELAKCDATGSPSCPREDNKINKEASNPPGNSPEKANVIHTANDSKASEKSVEDSKVETQTVTKQKSIEEASNPSIRLEPKREASNPAGKSESKLVIPEPAVKPSQAAEETSSKALAGIKVESGKANIIHTANDFKASEKEQISFSKFVEDCKVETRIVTGQKPVEEVSNTSIRQEPIKEASKPAEKSESKLISPGPAVKPSEPAEETSSSKVEIRIVSGQKSVEEAPSPPIRQESIQEASNPARKSESKLISLEPAVKPSHPAEETRSSKVETRIVTGQKSVEEAPSAPIRQEPIKEASNPAGKSESKLISPEPAVKPSQPAEETSSSKVETRIITGQKSFEEAPSSSIRQEPIKEASNPDRKSESKSSSPEPAVKPSQPAEETSSSKVETQIVTGQKSVEEASNPSIRQEPIQEASDPARKSELKLTGTGPAVKPSLPAEETSSKPIAGKEGKTGN